MNETPSQWCKRMQDKAKDGNDAYAYHQLEKTWKEREGDE